MDREHTVSALVVVVISVCPAFAVDAGETVATISPVNVVSAALEDLIEARTTLLELAAAA